ncbi:MAG: 16S rRNA (adenine(1518)-N(6)/adenine(1519)-N(6))-dimethyltransferase RsmA [Euryarchaeota archaeon]|nr:16S rRNA (adenine(1518)-N(6)/adenine(1519)-N(6))-dimethyltransferase RsmA [Euryarchaeota archaeon]
MKPRYGQHILIDQYVLDRIIRYARLTDEDTVLEIGGGTGNLTRKLSQVAGNVVTVEIDPYLAEGLNKTSATNVTVIQGDALKVHLPFFNKVVSNLPYMISSPITFALFHYNFDYAVLMYQLEFARRLLATPKTRNYGRLTVTAQYHASIEMLETVPPDAFKPNPKVNSAIVKLTPQDPPYKINDLDFFKEFLKAVFSQRRKKLKNSIQAAAPRLGIPLSNISGIDPGLLDMRPEDLAPDELARLAGMIGSGK